MTITTKEFSKLRLSKLLPNREINRVWYFEYLGKLWLGETYIFSHALQLYSNPFATKSIAISFEDLSEEEIDHISKKIGVSFSAASDEAQCVSNFGEPLKVENYCKDRKTFVYFLGSGPDYEIGFTILNGGGLVYFTMETIDVADNKALSGPGQ